MKAFYQKMPRALFALAFVCTSLAYFMPSTAQAQVHSRRDIYSFSPAERCELRNLMVTYLNLNGGATVLQHQTPTPHTFPDIHCYNEFFLIWHRSYIRSMEEWLLTQNNGNKYVPLPEWDPQDPIPCEFFNSSCATCTGSSIASGFGSMNNQSPSGYDFSPFLNQTTLCSYTSGTLSTPQWGKTRFGTAADNFAYYLQWEHNGPHVSIGGVMATGVSPAAAIFWLWHGYIDDIYRKYQCDCQGDTAKDLYIADSNEDVGNEPNAESTLIYLSPEIWVRTTQDAIGTDGRYLNETDPLRHENPEAGQTNYIYVRIRNIGCQATQANEANLRVYYSKASTGLSWPVTWDNYVVGSTTYGDEITTIPISIPAIPAGEQFVAEIPWLPPSPSTFGETTSHFCLLSRIESVADPMTFVETTGVAPNTTNNNNVAWKNLTIVDLLPFAPAPDLNEFVFEVIQPEMETNPIKLTFDKLGSFDLDQIILTAEPSIMDNFLLAGQPSGMEVIADPVNPGQKAFLILEDNASIEGLQLQPGQTVPLKMRFGLQCSDQGGTPCANIGDVYTYKVEQFTQTIFGDGFVGGVAYEIRIKDNGDTPCDPIIANAVVEQPVCENLASGYIGLELNGQAPYTIYWTNGENSAQNSGLLPGTYTATVVDNNNCVDYMQFELTDQSDLKVDFQYTIPYCGQSNGDLLAIPAGGTAPYTYTWADGNQEQGLSGIGPGQYVVVVTDETGCQRTEQFSMGMTMMLGGLPEVTNVSSPGASDGSILFVPTGGIPPYEYQWSNGANANPISDLATGNYALTLTDQTGCEVILDSIYVDLSSAVNQAGQAQKGFDIFPNPATETAFITVYHWNAATFNLRIIDASGALVKEQAISNNPQKLRVEIASLPKGQYILMLNDGKQSFSQKFIKQ